MRWGRGIRDRGPVDTHPTHRLRRSGAGRPLVLVHGLGASYDCWRDVVPHLVGHREVVVLDLPGFGRSASMPGPVTVASMSDHVERLLREADLLQADLVGSSMGGEIVLELLRRGHGRDVVALAPSGYWDTVGLAWFRLVAWTATVLVLLLRPLVPAIIGNRWGRVLLLRPLSPHPGRLPQVTVDSTHTFGTTTSFVPALRHLARRRTPVVVPAAALAGRRVTIGWGRKDGLCLPNQARRALAAVPGADLHWFDESGHLPPWDEPGATADLLLTATGSPVVSTPDETVA